MKTAKKLIPAIIVIILVLGGIGGGLFYLSYVESISIQNGQNGIINLDISDQELLIVNFPNKVYLNKACTYVSSDIKVATVDSNGKIVAVGVGESVITATSKVFDRTASVKVVVSHGKPDTVKVETVNNAKQYSDQTVKPIVFSAKSFRNGFESQDPENLKFKWVIKVDGEIKVDTTVSDNKYEYIPDSNTAQNIEVACTLVYNDVELTTKNATDTATANIYDKITEQDVSLAITSALVGGRTELGKELTIQFSYLSTKVDNTLTVKWKVAFNDGTYVNVDGQDILKYTPKENGKYAFQATIEEAGKFITKTIAVETKYQEVTTVKYVDNNKIVLPDNLSSFTATVKWNEYTYVTQTVTFLIVGADINDVTKTFSIDVTGNETCDLNVKPILNDTGRYVSFTVDGQDTGIVLKLDKLYTLKIYASIGNVKADDYYSFIISKGEVTNIKIVATTDSNLDNEENEAIVGRNNYQKEFEVDAVFYPLLTVTDVDWYVNNELVKGTDNEFIKVNSGGDIGEYHIYCISKQHRIKSNTLSIPSVNKNLTNEVFKNIAIVNGRTVNKYITCQSDLDALLEYSFLTENKMLSNVYFDTIMQDLWSSQGESDLYSGECFWVSDNSYTYRVNSNGDRTNLVNSSKKDCESMSRAFYRTAFSGNFSCNSLSINSLNKYISLRLTTIPTTVPLQVSSQQVMPERRLKGFAYTFDPPYSAVSGTNIRKFPIDDVMQTISVTTSSELYDAVENGYKPVPISGSMADKIYTKAREVLSTYVTDKMSDIEKAKIIYQWIIWTCTYDYEATSMTNLEINDAIKYAAYYLEGVFAVDGTIFNNQIAVCDGRSKAFVLLCAIEGIPSIRVTGTCYNKSNNSEAGGHAWNKVYLATAKGQPKQWYVVDTTWGDQKDNARYETYDEDMFLTTDNFHNNQASNSIYCVEDASVRKVPIANTVYKRVGTYGFNQENREMEVA